MKLLFSIFFMLALPILTCSQQITEITQLHNSIKETSGLIFLDQKLITHNDSGGEPALYEIDTVSGNITRKVFISNAGNTDWEDICNDSTYIYIGDFGNNNGSRTDLKIYRLLISDYLTSANDTVIVDSINFSYADQTDFIPAQFSSNFDAEALISYNDSLYIFTKNWNDSRTNIYALPKTPGTYQISKFDSLDSQGFITGAAYNSKTNIIMLTGYTFSPFIIELSQFTSNQFSNGTIKRYSIQLQGSSQLESIALLNHNQYYLTTEESTSGNSTLYRLNIPNNLVPIETIKKTANALYPNPASDFLNTQNNNFSDVEFYDMHGVLQKTSNKAQIDISNLPKGLYFIIRKLHRENKTEITKLLIK